MLFSLMYGTENFEVWVLGVALAYGLMQQLQVLRSPGQLLLVFASLMLKRARLF